MLTTLVCLLGTGAVSGLFAAACGGGDTSSVRPVPALATSLAAQREFRALEERFVRNDPADRDALRTALERFLAARGEDPRARTARVYLARLYVASAQWIVAESVLNPLLAGAEGPDRDLALVVRAEMELGQRRPDQAKRLLERVGRRLIDPASRSYYGEIATRTAIAMSDWRLAVLHLESWLLDSSDDRLERDQRAAGALIAKLPPAVLEQALAGLDEVRRRSGSVSAPRAWLRERLRDRLAAFALTTRDAALARRLLDADRIEQTSAGGDPALSRLAESSGAVARVAGRAVGFLTSLGNEITRRRSMAALAGMAAAERNEVRRRVASAERAQAAPGEVLRILVRDDAGSARNVEDALAALSGEGASLLVAGVDAETSLAAQAFARKSSIPVLLLEDPTFDELPDSVFVLGINENALRDLLIRALAARNWSSFAAIEATSAACLDPFGSSLTPPREERRGTGSELPSVLLFGSPECSRTLIQRYRDRGLGFALGLESAALFSSLGARRPGAESAHPQASPRDGRPARGQLLTLSAGTFLAGPPPQVSWFEALGHDAWVLANAALAGFSPTATIETTADVKRLHERARRQVAAADAALITSKARSFSSDHRLRRQFEVMVTELD